MKLGRFFHFLTRVHEIAAQNIRVHHYSNEGAVMQYFYFFTKVYYTTKHHIYRLGQDFIVSKT